MRTDRCHFSVCVFGRWTRFRSHTFIMRERSLRMPESFILLLLCHSQKMISLKFLLPSKCVAIILAVCVRAHQPNYPTSLFGFSHHKRESRLAEYFVFLNSRAIAVCVFFVGQSHHDLRQQLFVGLLTCLNANFFLSFLTFWLCGFCFSDS